VADVDEQADLLIAREAVLGEGAEDLPARLVIGVGEERVIAGLQPVHADSPTV
jgi:hypothetical protein